MVPTVTYTTHRHSRTRPPYISSNDFSGLTPCPQVTLCTRIRASAIFFLRRCGVTRYPDNHVNGTGRPDLASLAQPRPAMPVDLGIRGVDEENHSI